MTTPEPPAAWTDEQREAVFAAQGALALAAADLPCENGCGCEDYDYCAQDDARKALDRLQDARIELPYV